MVDGLMRWIRYDGRVVENSGQGKAKQYRLGRSNEKW